jgi:hypothetical protein
MDDLGHLELDVLQRTFEQRRAAAEEDGHDVDEDLVQEPGRQVLADDLTAAGELDLLA